MAMKAGFKKTENSLFTIKNIISVNKYISVFKISSCLFVYNLEFSPLSKLYRKKCTEVQMKFKNETVVPLYYRFKNITTLFNYLTFNLLL